MPPRNTDAPPKAGSTHGKAPSTESLDWGDLLDQPLPPPDLSAWPEPLPLGEQPPVPPFPVEVLPGWLGDWVTATAEAVQVPPDLPAMLALAVCGAGLAGKFRVQVREGYGEPVSVFAVVALPPGERKSAVFAEALRPVQDVEAEERQRMGPVVAEAESAHRQLEAALRHRELLAAKADGDEKAQLRDECKRLARDLAAHHVPHLPQLWADDCTAERIAQLLAQQGGRMLVASAEGTPFEILKGRYSEGPNFEVWLKGHAGDPLRVDRMNRPGDTVDRPALSAALAVQPDVLEGLAAERGLRRRGFLARWFYALPASRMGRREEAPPAVPAAVTRRYAEVVSALWRLPGDCGPDGKSVAHLLAFSREADQRFRLLHRWLEPLLAPDGELACLSGWAQKLVGACARLAAILHMATALGGGKPWGTPVADGSARAAIELGKDYLLPHARSAFALLGADEKLEKARRLWRAILRRSGTGGTGVTEGEPVRYSRRELQRLCHNDFKRAQDMDAPLEVLTAHYLLLPVEGSGIPGRGHSSPVYAVNPRALQEHSPPGATGATLDHELTGAA